MNNLIVFFTDGTYREHGTSESFFDECVEDKLYKLKTRVRGVLVWTKNESLETVFKKFLNTYFTTNFFMLDRKSFTKTDAELAESLLRVFLDDEESLAMKTICRECLLCLLRKYVTDNNLRQYQKVKEYLGLFR